MKNKKALITTVCGAAAALLSGILIIIGIIESIERSQYQDLGMNMPVVVLLAVLFIAGVVALVMGVRKMKSGK